MPDHQTEPFFLAKKLTLSIQSLYEIGADAITTHVKNVEDCIQKHAPMLGTRINNAKRTQVGLQPKISYFHLVWFTADRWRRVT